MRSMSTVEFKPLMAPALGNRKGTREAIDVLVDGEALSTALDAAPLDRVAVQSMPQAAWFRDGALQPVVCQCGDSMCSDVTTIVRREGVLVRWTLPNGRAVVFEPELATESLRAALRQ
ncbi:MAG: hypothetical protein M9961_14395 [Ilumatobacteraceae bacterium]|nr:hypothetical protein [Ilumatobacteraceae bacterium]